MTHRLKDGVYDHLLDEALAALAEAAREHCAARESPLGPGETHVPAPQHLRLVRPRPALGAEAPVVLPETPLAESALLVNASGEPSLGRELCRELASADRVDLLCAFVKWSGLRFVLDDLRALVERVKARREPTPLRVLATTYIGASDIRAIEELARLGAEVRISYDDRRTHLHAKAWLFHRESGSHTAYIGSSNLSHAALHEGLEWNVRLAWRDSGPLLDKFRAAFESYWDSDEFEAFDAARDRERVVKALAAQRGADGTGAQPLRFDLRPHPYQEPMLEALQVERERGHTRNLLVAPTGTGKTLVAAFDYAHLCGREGHRPRLFFVAHRERILSQSRGAFAAVLREPALRIEARGGFRRCAWRKGTKQDLSARFALRRVTPAGVNAEREAQWLLIEWRDGEKEPANYFLATLPENITKRQLIRVVMQRWRTERVYEDLKGELGLDHFEGRRFRGWHHHVSVALCCYAFIVAERVQRFPPSARRPLRDRPKPIAARAPLPRQLHHRAALNRPHRRVLAAAVPGLPPTTEPVTQ